jgi:hypothetical protein
VQPVDEHSGNHASLLLDACRVILGFGIEQLRQRHEAERRRATMRDEEEEAAVGDPPNRAFLGEVVEKPNYRHL